MQVRAHTQVSIQCLVQSFCSEPPQGRPINTHWINIEKGQRNRDRGSREVYLSSKMR